MLLMHLLQLVLQLALRRLWLRMQLLQRQTLPTNGRQKPMSPMRLRAPKPLHSAIITLLVMHTRQHYLITKKRKRKFLTTRVLVYSVPRIVLLPLVILSRLYMRLQKWLLLVKLMALALLVTKPPKPLQRTIIIPSWLH